MKWFALLSVSMFFVGCAHKFHPERSISSIQEQEKAQRFIEPRGVR
jgi:hypothetical protein